MNIPEKYNICVNGFSLSELLYSNTILSLMERAQNLRAKIQSAEVKQVKYMPSKIALAEKFPFSLFPGFSTRFLKAICLNMREKV